MFRISVAAQRTVLDGEAIAPEVEGARDNRKLLSDRSARIRNATGLGSLAAKGDTTATEIRRARWVGGLFLVC